MALTLTPFPQPLTPTRLHARRLLRSVRLRAREGTARAATLLSSFGSLEQFVGFDSHGSPFIASCALTPLRLFVASLLRSVLIQQISGV